MTECVSYTSVETLYAGHDNAITIIPYSDYPERTVYDMTDVTLVTASADLVDTVASPSTADSDDAPTTIWWNQVGEEWRIHLKVGLFVGITEGSYVLRIVIYDPTHINGLVIADDLRVDIVGVHI